MKRLLTFFENLKNKKKRRYVDPPPQFRCNKAIRCSHYLKTFPEDHEEIFKQIEELIEHYKDKKIYIGITHHPCGRYNLSYNSTKPLPPCMGFQNTITKEDNAELIQEGGHEDEYESMYLICSHATAKVIEDLEIEMIAKMTDYMREKGYSSARIGNKSKGGEPMNAESTHYFLYVCISKLAYIAG
jgi:hypothetical protein